MKLDINNHSVFKLNYHLIMVVKYRRKVIDDTISARLKIIFEDIGGNYLVTVKEWNHDMSASSRRIKNEFSAIRQKLWEEYFWSQSYCLLTVGGAPLEILKQYIETQGQK